MTETAFYHALNILAESDYRKLAKLKQIYKKWEEAWHNLPGEYRNGGGHLPDPEAEWQKLKSLNIILVLFEDENYPPLLKEIPYPPHGLYVRGNLPSHKETILAIVGTRKATADGKELARKFGKELASGGVVISSGLALGIDAMAHQGAIEAGGKTVAVLANGVDSPYPRLHDKLAKRIIDCGGAIISEYPPGSPPYPSRFLERNRIVSGISNGILIVEAPEASGALATARFATDQNRELMVVPGPATHPNFTGSHRLIRAGAELITTPQEVLLTLGLQGTKTLFEETLLQTEEEKIIFATIKNHTEPLSIDKIIELTNLKPNIVNQALSFLLVKNAIKETERGYLI